MWWNFLCHTHAGTLYSASLQHWGTGCHTPCRHTIPLNSQDCQHKLNYNLSKLANPSLDPQPMHEACFCVNVPCNLGICAISKLRCAFLESGNCAPISRLRITFAQSWDCASAICERNGLTRGERPSWLTEESWELSETVMPWMGALHRSGISLFPYQTEGKGVSPSWWTSQKPLGPGAGVWVYMPDIEGDDGAARAYYVRLLPLYTMETWRVQLCTLQKLRYLEIAHRCRAISRLRKPSAQSRDWHAISGFWECTAQSRDCTNSQIARNINIGVSS